MVRHVPHYGVDCLSEYWRRMSLNADALIEIDQLP
jgi:hypothetical protein